MGWAYRVSKRGIGRDTLLWDTRVVKLVKEFVGEYLVACSFTNVDNDYKWSFVGIYGPNVNNTKYMFG